MVKSRKVKPSLLGGVDPEETEVPVRRRRKGTTLSQLEKRVRKRRASSASKSLGNILQGVGRLLTSSNTAMAKSTRNMPSEQEIYKSLWG